MEGPLVWSLKEGGVPFWWFILFFLKQGFWKISWEGPVFIPPRPQLWIYGCAYQEEKAQQTSLSKIVSFLLNLTSCRLYRVLKIWQSHQKLFLFLFLSQFLTTRKRLRNFVFFIFLYPLKVFSQNFKFEFELNYEVTKERTAEQQRKFLIPVKSKVKNNLLFKNFFYKCSSYV